MVLDREKILNLLQQKESVTLEFKTCTKKISNSVYETVCAFLNTIGGYIFLGVEDNGNIVGVNEEFVKDLRVDFSNTLNSQDKLDPPMPIMLNEAYIDGKIILYAYIAESSEIHQLNRKIYYRSNEGDRDITKNRIMVKKLYNRKSNYTSDSIVYPNLKIDDFDENTITFFKTHLPMNHPFKDLDNETILKQDMFYKTDELTGRMGYTRSALLLFGKSIVISNLLPWYRVDILKRINDIIRYDDRFISENNLIKAYTEVINYLCKNVDKPFFLKEFRTYDAVSDLIREIVSNILIHRDYVSPEPTRIYIYKDRLEFINPNVPLTYSEVNLNNYMPMSKNLTISKVFRLIKYADEIGSGFIKINDICKNYLKTTPMIFDDEYFKIQIFLKESNILNNDNLKEELNLSSEEKILNYIKLNGKITNEECRKLLDIERARVKQLFAKLVKENKIKKEGNGPSTYYVLHN